MKTILNKIQDCLKELQAPFNGIELIDGPVIVTMRASLDNIRAAEALVRCSDILEKRINTRIRVFNEGAVLCIEVPKEKSEQKHPDFDSAMEDRSWAAGKNLPLFLGYGSGWSPVVLDLADCPHILVGGATMQGKSVLLRSLIDSLLTATHPGDIKLYLADAKIIEFSCYRPLDKSFFFKEGIVEYNTSINHLLTRLCTEMDKRLRTFGKEGCRNIQEYRNSHDDIPYIVVAINEYADYFGTKESQKDEFISLLRRLTAKGRSAGIHFIISTQRPCFHNIPAEIHSGFPVRIATRCASSKDSQAILDTISAEKLVGQGDMLLCNMGNISRFQGLLDEEKQTDSLIRKLNSHIGQITPIASCQLEKYPSNECDEAPAEFLSKRTAMEENEDLVAAARCILQAESLSAVNLQRTLCWGYSRACRVLATLEKMGIAVKGQDSAEGLSSAVKEKLNTIINKSDD